MLCSWWRHVCVYDEEPLNQGEHVFFYQMNLYILVHRMVSFPTRPTTHALHAYLSASSPALYLISSLHPPSYSYPPLTSTSPSQHISPLGSQGEEPDSIHSWIWTFEQSAVEWGGQWVCTCGGKNTNHACLLLYCIHPPTSLAVFFSNGFRPSDHISNRTIP